MNPTAVRSARPALVRAAVSGVIALGGLVTASLGQLFTDRKGTRPDPATTGEQTLAIIGAAIALVAGIAAVRWLASAARRASEAYMEEGRQTALKILITATGYVVVVLATLAALGANIQGLVLGGAFAGVVVGIAAQQTLGNFFAGIVLLLVRPFTVGEEVVLRSGALGGEYAGTVTDVTLFYVRMATKLGPVALPNAGVLAAAIGPGARSEAEEDLEAEEDPGAAHGGTVGA